MYICKYLIFYYLGLYSCLLICLSHEENPVISFVSVHDREVSAWRAELSSWRQTSGRGSVWYSSKYPDHRLVCVVVWTVSFFVLKLHSKTNLGCSGWVVIQPKPFWSFTVCLLLLSLSRSSDLIKVKMLTNKVKQNKKKTSCSQFVHCEQKCFCPCNKVSTSCLFFVIAQIALLCFSRFPAQVTASRLEATHGTTYIPHHIKDTRGPTTSVQSRMALW